MKITHLIVRKQEVKLGEDDVLRLARRIFVLLALIVVHSLLGHEMAARFLVELFLRESAT